MWRIAVSIGLAAVAVQWPPGRALGATLLDQPATWPESRDSRTSQHDQVFNTQTFDNFQIGLGGVISSIEFQGLYVTNSGEPQPAPQPYATHFYIGFWADDGGFIGDLIAGQHYEIANISEQLVAEIPFTFGDVPTTAAIYNYQMNIAPFVASPDEPYWILVQAATSDFAVYWAWNSGSGGDNFSRQVNGIEVADFDTDRAITMNSHLLPVAAADFDEDGDVDGDDLVPWTTFFGTESAIHGDGDASGDHTVDGADVLIWQQQLMIEGPIATLATVAAPEGSSWRLAFVAGALALAASRPQRRANEVRQEV